MPLCVFEKLPISSYKFKKGVSFVSLKMIELESPVCLEPYLKSVTNGSGHNNCWPSSPVSWFQVKCYTCMYHASCARLSACSINIIPVVVRNRRLHGIEVGEVSAVLTAICCSCMLLVFVPSTCLQPYMHAYLGMHYAGNYGTCIDAYRSAQSPCALIVVVFCCVLCVHAGKVYR